METFTATTVTDRVTVYAESGDAPSFRLPVGTEVTVSPAPRGHRSYWKVTVVKDGVTFSTNTLNDKMRAIHLSA